MEIDAETQQRLLDLLHDLLNDEEAAELRARITADPQLARAYAEAQQAASLFSEAAKLKVERIELRAPLEPAVADSQAASSEAVGAKTPRTNGAGLRPKVRRLTRGANWAMGVASAVLILISVGGYYQHRGQLADIAAEYLRLMVLGPARLRAGVAQEYTVITTSVTGAPVSAQVEFALFPPAGERMGHLQRTDESGRLRVSIPADRLVPGQARLEIRAKGQDQSQIERMDLRVGIDPPEYTTHLSLDKRLYRPGETVRYRSLTLSRTGLIPDRDLPVRLEILDPGGVTLAASRQEGLTQRGVGCGQFAFPADSSPGTYVLTVHSIDGSFPGRREPLVVERQRAGDRVKPQAAAGDPGKATVAEVEFHPEGGSLVPEMANRVYFSARDAQDRPVAISARVVDSEGHNVARLQTLERGLGTFTLEPRPGEQYRLKIDHPGGTKIQPRLPEVASAGQVVLTTGVGIFGPGKPLEFNVRAAEAGIPLVAAACCGGVMVGEEALVTQGKANSVQIPLADEVAGVARLTLYDCRVSPPRPLAQRLVYRRPARRLQIRLAEPPRRYSPGQSVDLALEVTDENDSPTPAVLGVAVIGRAAGQSAGDRAPALSTRFLLGTAIERPEDMELADFYLSGDPKAALALDLLLGAQGRRRAAARQDKQSPSPDADAPLPAVFDNLTGLQARYEGTLASYRATRTRLWDTLIVVSFFGGGGLVLLAAMLSLLGITSGIRLWTISVAVAATCLILGTTLMNPERRKPPKPGAVSFAAFQVAPNETDGAAAAAKSAPGTAPAGPIRVQAASPKPPASPLPALPVHTYAYTRPQAAAPGIRGAGETLFWNPLLVTGSDGRTQIRFDLPASPTVCRVQVDAFADGGRLGSVQLEIVSGNNPDEE